jgi:predicted amidohydrolase
LALENADRNGVDVLVMPECFLHGYLGTRAEALSTAQDNSTAQKLYESEGYQLDTQCRHYYLPV